MCHWVTTLSVRVTPRVVQLTRRKWTKQRARSRRCDRPGGAKIPVTKENVKEFVRLYIDWQFRKQCELQLASFKKGFTRMLDMRVIKALFDYEEVETLICGQRELHFEELRDHCIYANGYTPTSQMMTWLWEIVLDEWDDANRRKWLTFCTGSDRAPVNGLKSMKFFII